MAVLALAALSGILLLWQPSWLPLPVSLLLPLFFVLSFAFGLMMTSR